MHSSMRVIFMRQGIAKVHEKPISEQLGNMSIKACDDFRTSRLIGMDDFPVLFGIELGRESGRIDQITEHHGELATFRFGYTRFSWGKYTLWRLIVEGRRLWLCLERW